MVVCGFDIRLAQEREVLGGVAVEVVPDASVSSSPAPAETEPLPRPPSIFQRGGHFLDHPSLLLNDLCLLLGRSRQRRHQRFQLRHSPPQSLVVFHNSRRLLATRSGANLVSR